MRVFFLLLVCCCIAQAQELGSTLERVTYQVFVKEYQKLKEYAEHNPSLENSARLSRAKTRAVLAWEVGFRGLEEKEVKEWKAGFKGKLPLNQDWKEVLSKQVAEDFNKELDPGLVECFVELQKKPGMTVGLEEVERALEGDNLPRALNGLIRIIEVDAVAKLPYSILQRAYAMAEKGAGVVYIGQ